LRIHIVQKGDILYDIAKKYDVDFDEIVKMNPQLSSPDMIMPGMKIKIPSESKQVRSDEKGKEMAIKAEKVKKREVKAERKFEKREVKAERRVEKREAEYARPKITERPMGKSLADDYGAKKDIRAEMPRDIGSLYPPKLKMQLPKASKQSYMEKKEGEVKQEKAGVAGERFAKEEMRYQPQTPCRPMKEQRQPPMPSVMGQMGMPYPMMHACCCQCMQPMHGPTPRSWSPSWQQGTAYDYPHMPSWQQQGSEYDDPFTPSWQRRRGYDDPFTPSWQQRRAYEDSYMPSWRMNESQQRQSYTTD